MRQIGFVRIVASLYPVCIITRNMHIINLYTTSFACTLHARSNIDSISPNVIVRFPCSDHAGCDRSVVDSKPQYEMVKRLLVDGSQCPLKLQSKFYQARQMCPSNLYAVWWLFVKKKLKPCCLSNNIEPHNVG